MNTYFAVLALGFALGVLFAAAGVIGAAAGGRRQMNEYISCAAPPAGGHPRRRRAFRGVCGRGLWCECEDYFSVAEKPAALLPERGAADEGHCDRPRTGAGGEKRRRKRCRRWALCAAGADAAALSLDAAACWVYGGRAQPRAGTEPAVPRAVVLRPPADCGRGAAWRALSQPDAGTDCHVYGEVARGRCAV